MFLVTGCYVVVVSFGVGVVVAEGMWTTGEIWQAASVVSQGVLAWALTDFVQTERHVWNI